MVASKLNEQIVGVIATTVGLRFNPDGAFVRALAIEMEKLGVAEEVAKYPPAEAMTSLANTFLGDRVALLNRMPWRGTLRFETSVGEMTLKFDTYAEWENVVNAARIAQMLLGSDKPKQAEGQPTQQPNTIEFEPARLVCQLGKNGKYWRLYGTTMYKDYGVPIYPEVLKTVLPDFEQKDAGYVMKFDPAWRAIAEFKLDDGKKKVQRILRVWQECSQS